MSLKTIINNSLCTGCGVCISEDGSNKSKMIWNNDGFYEPAIDEESNLDAMESVCPFNLLKNPALNEDALAEEFIDQPQFRDSDIGLYTGLYAGYAKEYRATSSSGGMATFIFEKLLKQKHVEHLFIVREFEGRYAYQLFDDANQIKQISKTRYYPVTLASLFDCIDKIEGRVAVSGVACFVKAIRLKQNKHPELKAKIPFLVGIICGGLKSKYYTDFLVQSTGCNKSYENPEYRVKNADSFALDYKFSCVESDNKRIHVVDMQSLGDMWGTGLFKSNACDFCDDVTTELADISLGDAWIPPYNREGLGNSVVIARSQLANSIIIQGIDDGELSLNCLDIMQVKSSQNGSFNHRHKGLSYRIDRAIHKGIPYPEKRIRFIVKQNIFINIIQYLRMQTRSKSLIFWKSADNINEFNLALSPYLKRLRVATKVNHKFNRLKQVIKKNKVNK